jgi:hypothetical protein
MTREELKRELLAKAEAAIDEMLGKKPANNKITLREIEGLAIQTGQRLEAEVLGSLLASSGPDSGADGPVCASCGRKMQRKGWRKRRVISEAGESEIRRPYYYCEQCKTGTFPPG